MSGDVTEIVVWSPQPGPQRHAIQCPLDDLFYGGARGGGKTDFLLGDFAARAQKYGAHLQGILFRRTIDELTDVIGRSKEIYGPLGWRYNESKHTWRAPNGAFLYLRYLDRDADAEHYKGWNNQWLGFDELDQWPSPKPIDKLWATLRSRHGIPCVRRCTGNPGGPGHAWIKKRYRPHLWRQGLPYIHTKYQPQPEELPDLWIEAVFIPARLEDNIVLQQNDPGYEARLAASAGSAQLFRAWRRGDWDVLAGAYFDLFTESLHTLTPKATREQMQPWHPRWLSMDWGFTDDFAVHWYSSNEEKRVVTYQELVGSRVTAPNLGELIASKCVVGEDPETGEPKYDALQDFILSPDAFGTKESERTIADEIGDVMAKYGLPRPRRAIAGPNTRVPGWQLLYQLLESGYWKISKDCPDLIESLPMLMRDEDNPEDCADHPRDHSPDSARMGLTTFLRTPKESVQSKADRMVTAVDQTARALQHMKAETMIAKATRPVKLRPRRLY